MSKKILPCNCEEGSKSTTYVEKDLNGVVFGISCSECDDVIDWGNTDHIIKDWNKEKKK